MEKRKKRGFVNSEMIIWVALSEVLAATELQQKGARKPWPDDGRRFSLSGEHNFLISLFCGIVEQAKQIRINRLVSHSRHKQQKIEEH